MKRNLFKVVALIVAAVSMSGLASCNSSEIETPPSVEHTHTYSEDWTYDETYHWHEATCEHTDEVSEKAAHTWNSGEVITPEGCETEGVLTYTCTVCGATKEESIAAKGHTYSEEWSHDELYHWHAATCEHKDLVIDYGEHTYENGVCTVCEEPFPVTEGLEYTLINNDTEYEVIGIGSANTKNIFIPSTYNNLPVTSIGEDAFTEEEINYLWMPDSITNIGARAFYYCDELKEIILSNNITVINEQVFRYCSSLEEIVLPNRLTSIENEAFYFLLNKSSLLKNFNLYLLGYKII